MDDYIGFIIFALIFVIAPLIEQARRKQKRPPGQQIPRTRTEPRPPAAPPRSQRTAEGSRTEEVSAATMLPDELWEVLTGQPRPRPVPAPAPDVEDEVIVDEESLITEDAEIQRRRPPSEEGQSLEEMTRRELPVVVSLETMPTPRARHAAFHAKVDQPTLQPTRVAPASTFTLLRGRKNLRQAMLLQAVLGVPKALE